ncbi:MAG: CaiB/BaiF CoA-transferase family protein [Bryobacteraceae bacterium]|jgi:crotonobetainyl-CoA:carnitine CoA-transferase CaiB-like acyl-CoA transferase
MRPLDGLVVLDLTRLLPGAAATLQLANFGAEVVKIEEPERGDYARWMPPYLDGEGAVFHMVNRGKKSVTLDLKSVPGREAFLKLAETADVAVESFRPGTMQRLGLSFETLRALNPRLIYVSITGYGQEGPWASLAGHDINYQALGGALDLNGARGGPPAIPGIQIADLAGAMQAVTGVLLALAARAQTGRGQAVNVSMLESVASLLPVALGFHAATGELPVRGDGALTGRYACYRVYQTADERWIAVGALEPKFWQALCRELDCERFIADQFAEGPRQEEVGAELARIFRTRTAEEWFGRLRAADACVTPVRNIAEVAAHFGLDRGDSVVTPGLSDTPGGLGGPPPRLGEHNSLVGQVGGDNLPYD